MDKLRIAIIGYGYWGPNLVRNFWKNSEILKKKTRKDKHL